MKKLSFFVLAAVFCLGLINRTAEAGRLPEEWDALPQVESFAFTKTAIGLVAGDHSYFILDTKEGTFKEIPETEFKRQFPAPTQRSAEVVNNTGIGSEVRLRTSGALTFFVTNAYCSEGETLRIDFLSMASHSRILSDLATASVRWKLLATNCG